MGNSDVLRKNVGETALNCSRGRKIFWPSRLGGLLQVRFLDDIPCLLPRHNLLDNKFFFRDSKGLVGSILFKKYRPFSLLQRKSSCPRQPLEFRAPKYMHRRLISFCGSPLLLKQQTQRRKTIHTQSIYLLKRKAYVHSHSRVS